MGASNYAEEAVINALFGKTSAFGTLSSRPTLYVALLTAAPSDTDTGSTIAEAAYTGYNRVATAPADWNAWSAGSLSNAVDIEFGEATAGSDTLTHFALVDAATAGNVILYGALDASLAVSAGITPRFKAGDLAVTAD